jgi:hypothetical protein
MYKAIGKAKTKLFFFLVLVFCNLGATQTIGALPVLEFGMGFADAWTKTQSTATGYHNGWNVSAEANWIFRISLDNKDIHNAGKEIPPPISIILSPGFHAQYIDMSASNWLSDGSCYRAWSAIGLGPELEFGLEFVDSIIVHRSLLFSVAYLANFSNYTQTTLYSAYNSWLLKVSWNTKIDRGLAFFMALPLEYAFRADGKSILSGLVMGIRYEF